MKRFYFKNYSGFAWILTTVFMLLLNACNSGINGLGEAAVPSHLSTLKTIESGAHTFTSTANGTNQVMANSQGENNPTVESGTLNETSDHYRATLVIENLFDISGDFHYPRPTLNFFQREIEAVDGKEAAILTYSVSDEFPQPIALYLKAKIPEPYIYDLDRPKILKRNEEIEQENRAAKAEYLKQVQEKIINKIIPDSVDGSFVTINILGMTRALKSPEFSGAATRIPFLYSNQLDSPKGKKLTKAIDAHYLTDLEDASTQVFCLGVESTGFKSAIMLDHYDRFIGSLKNL